jgi:hypothetical protein
MERDLVAKNVEEFEKLVEKGNLIVSDILVDTILSNLKTKKKHIHAFSIYFEDTENSYDITIDRENFIDILKKNLYIQERFEHYEKCSKILKTIKSLEKKSLPV